MVDSFVARLLFPAAAVGMALVAEQRGWGLLNQVELPYVVALPLTGKTGRYPISSTNGDTAPRHDR